MAEVGNWIAENCTTAGAGDLFLAGPIDGTVTFVDGVPAGEVWYSIVDGFNREAGVGVFDGVITITRTSIYATLFNGVFDDNSPAPINLTGDSIVACTFNATAFEEIIADIAQNAAGVAQNASDITQNANDVATKVNRAGDQMTGQLGGVGPVPVAAEDLTRKDYVDAADLVLQDQIDGIDPNADFDDKLEGYATGGLHKLYIDDVDAILVNSNYEFEQGVATNVPADFPANQKGFITTDIQSDDDTEGTQSIIGMTGDAANKTWSRTKEAGIWGAWEQSVGGATISSTPPDNPSVGQGWWDDELGRAFIWYDDGDSQQWVEEDPANTGNATVVTIGMTAQFPNGAGEPWLLCDGQAVSRTTYPTLFAYLGVVYGNGDGSTTFNVPDYRGKFLRGTDRGRGIDPDAAARGDRGDGVTGDNVGTTENMGIESHSHVVDNSNGTVIGSTGGRLASNLTNTLGNGTDSELAGGNETRPVNVYTDWYILSDVAATVVDTPELPSGWQEVGVQLCDGVKTQFDFAIPAGAKQIIVTYDGLGNFGDSTPLQILFGVGGVPQVTGYEAIQAEVTNNISPLTKESATHFNGPAFVGGDAYGYNSYIKFGSGLNRWMQGGSAIMKNFTIAIFGGRVDLLGELDMIRVQTNPGDDPIQTGGSINVGYQL